MTMELNSTGPLLTDIISPANAIGCSPILQGDDGQCKRRARNRALVRLPKSSALSMATAMFMFTLISAIAPYSFATDTGEHKSRRPRHRLKRRRKALAIGNFTEPFLRDVVVSPVLNVSRMAEDDVLIERERWLRQTPAIARILDDVYNYNYQAVYDDGYTNDDINSYLNDDTSAAYDDAYAATNDDNTDDYQQTMAAICEDKTCTVNEECTKFLFGFLEGTTDAKDNCEGIMNAYLAADCGAIKKMNQKDTTIYNDDDDFNDDYFGIFYDHQCCSSLRSHYYEYCDSSGILNENNLLVVAAVMLLCECAKSIVKKNKIHFMPEAAACMVVGMVCGIGAQFFGTTVEEIAFDEEIFMYLLLPPIIFEAALSVNKREFRRRRGAIIIFAVFGTLLSSFMTGAITYYSAKYFTDNSLPILDCLVFGSLISSIDPVAILSVLTSLKMSETDTIYILVFGESLLNDGIAITLFKSLVEHYESKSTASFDDILGSIADFLIIACGSCAIGLACGVACLCYFHLNSSILHPVMEVASFFLWAVVPYWMAEAFEWSGIVAIVVMGFFMDIYLRPGWDLSDFEQEEEGHRLMIAEAQSRSRAFGSNQDNCDFTHGHPVYYNYNCMENDEDSLTDGRFRFRGTAVDIPRPDPGLLAPSAAKPQTDKNAPHRATSTEVEAENGDGRSLGGTSMTTPNVKAILMKREFVRMSREADEHVRFVAHILSQMSENAIFAYLGLFLFSSKYEWDAILCSIGVTSCILSRAVMVVCASWFIWYMHVFRQRAGCQSNRNPCISDDFMGIEEKGSSQGESDDDVVDPLNTPISKSARALSNAKVQVVLILAGLRGAVSLALVESVPIYNGVTGVGSKNKPLLKAMTSSSIIFTIFVLGGGAYYILKWLDISSDDMLIKTTGPSTRNGSYAYPPLYCGAQMTEMELASPSFEHRVRSPVGLARNNSLTPQPPAAFSHTLSVDSRASSNTCGLNSIIARQLSKGAESAAGGDIITMSRNATDPDKRPSLTLT